MRAFAAFLAALMLNTLPIAFAQQKDTPGPPHRSTTEASAV